eukprot:CAMPEP_0175730778 /NCGR_PEP_ID=MMETSP0097-20121207/50500_1 /TAXON_ID=311494 /ORGANISM="Alexandrium monilatum, Strain CCMP3105" /LENGTH=148 /DNA_ID=CAMNT_0017038693 /DNA_START=65 /DNA_END=508 /DNA_ORIENTATION=-
MPFTSREIKLILEAYEPDIINVYYAFVFNLILWFGVWFMTFNKDPNPIPAIALAGMFVLAFPRSYLVQLHEHDHVTSLPLYPYSLIVIAVVLSYLPWRYIVRPAVRENDRRVKEKNAQNQNENEVRATEGGRRHMEDEGVELHQRKVR